MVRDILGPFKDHAVRKVTAYAAIHTGINLQIGRMHHRATVSWPVVMYIIRTVVSSYYTPSGAGVPHYRLCSSLVHSLPHLLLFITFSLFFFSFTLLIFFYCPSDPFLPESPHSVSRFSLLCL